METKKYTLEEMQKLAGDANVFALCNTLLIQAALEAGHAIADIAFALCVSPELVQQVDRARKMVIIDYPPLLRRDENDGPVMYVGPNGSKKVDEALQEIRDLNRDETAPRHEFRCMWSIGDSESGYEFSAKHPGNEAMASGAVESWTPSQLADHLNEMEKLRKPFVATGKAAAFHDDEDEDEADEPKRVRQAPKHIRDANKHTKYSDPNRQAANKVAKEVGPKFKALRVKAGINQSDAGKLIGENQSYVSMLERGMFPKKGSQAEGLRMKLAEFEELLKTQGLIEA